MRRKAQMQMTETIFVVFIIMIIVLLGFVFYSKFQEQSLKEKQKENRNLKIIEMAHRMSFWPELECSEAGVSEFMCLDRTKLITLGKFIIDSKQENSQLNYAFNYYWALLGNSKITVTEIYPSFTHQLGLDYWEIWNNTGTKRTTDVVRIPVSIYNPLTTHYAFGIMELQAYE